VRLFSKSLQGDNVAKAPRRERERQGSFLTWEEAAKLVSNAESLSKNEFKRQVREQQRLYAKAVRAATVRPPPIKKAKMEDKPERNVSLVFDMSFGALMKASESRKLAHQIRSECTLSCGMDLL
jgi:hypothetical protein